MKHLKTIVLFMAAMLVLAAPASAATLTSSWGATPPLAAQSEGEMTFHNKMFTPFLNVTCGSSSFEGQVESHGVEGAAGGKLSKLTFTECNTLVTVKTSGSLEIHPAGGGNGTVTWSGAEITFVMQWVGGGYDCVYRTNKTHIGTLTKAPGLSGHAVMDIDAAIIPVVSGPQLYCGTSLEWTGKYKFTTPTGLSVDP